MTSLTVDVHENTAVSHPHELHVLPLVSHPNCQRMHILFKPAAGGGLSSGITDVCAIAAPDAQMYTCEPRGFEKMRRSLAEGCRLSNDRASGSICDALLAPMPGVLPFEVLQRRAARGLSVSDDEVKEAMRIAFAHLRLILEPGGAAALAAALSADFRSTLKNRVTIVIASGGNVDPHFFAEVITSPTPVPPLPPTADLDS